jgi:hypothetical protein
LGFVGESAIGNLGSLEKTAGAASQQGIQELEGKQVLKTGGQKNLAHENLLG